MNGRLLLIEMRRTIAVLLALPMFLLAWQTLGAWFVRLVVLWPDLSFVIGKGATLIGPVLAGAAAWMAGREQRRGLAELLHTTPHAPFARLLATLTGTLGWGVLAYGVFAIFASLWTARRATWGGPDGWPIAVGLLALGTYATLGFLLGTLLPSRFTAPLVALAVFALQISVLPVANRYPALYQAQWLFLFTHIDTTVWFGSRPPVAPFQALFSVGLTILGLVGLACYRGRPHPLRSVAAVSLAAVLVMASIVGVFQRAPTREQMRGYWSPNFPPQSYIPVCSAAPLRVCVHPAYTAALPQVSADLNDLLSPLIGLPGFPTQAEQSALSGISRVVQSADTLPYALDSYNTYNARTTALYCAIYACPTDTLGPVGAPPPGDLARAVIAAWLWVRVEGPGTSSFGSCGIQGFTNSLCSASARFAALTPESQHTWLVAHFADLRAGRLTLEDLP
jgi:hypothetical protein